MQQDRETVDDGAFGDDGLHADGLRGFANWSARMDLRGTSKCPRNAHGIIFPRLHRHL